MDASSNASRENKEGTVHRKDLKSVIHLNWRIDYYRVAPNEPPLAYPWPPAITAKRYPVLNTSSTDKTTDPVVRAIKILSIKLLL